MPLVQIRNRKSRVVLGQVWCEDVAGAIDALVEATGSSIDEIAGALGSSVDEAKANFEMTIVQAAPPQARAKTTRKSLDHLPRRLA